MKRFYLGTHEPSWLSRTTLPLFVSRRRLQRLRSLPRAAGRWALDSGGFTELAMHGRWRLAAADYASLVDRYSAEVGGLDFAAPQDWMCEPFMVAKTGLSIREHQERTVQNYLDLTSLAPGLPWIPVLQGWEVADYVRCAALYAQAGVDLAAVPLIGLGSVCRRQHTAQIAHLVSTMSPLPLHGFGVKTDGLAAYGYLLQSADSMAWSFRARRSEPLPGCTHRSCANCFRYATGWAETVTAGLNQPVQASLFDREVAA